MVELITDGTLAASGQPGSRRVACRYAQGTRQVHADRAACASILLPPRVFFVGNVRVRWPRVCPSRGPGRSATVGVSVRASLFRHGGRIQAQRCLAGGIRPCPPFSARPFGPATMSDGAWVRARHVTWLLQRDLSNETRESGGDYPLLGRGRSYYPASSPPAGLVPMPRFSLSRASAGTPTASTPPFGTRRSASTAPPPRRSRPAGTTPPPEADRRTRPSRGVARRRPTSPGDWTTSDYSTRMRRECVASWRALVWQPWSISFEREVLAHSRELSACRRAYGRRYPSLASSGTGW